MKQYLINFALFILAISLGLTIFYFAPLSNRILENIAIPGKISKLEAEKIVEEAGFYPVSSWYQIVGISPYVVVMSENEAATKTGKIYVGAFNSQITENELNNNEAIEKKNLENIEIKDPIKETNILADLSLVSDQAINQTINNFLKSRYSSIELIDKSHEENWGKELMNVNLWADDYHVFLNFDISNGELNELKEEHWNTKKGASAEAILDNEPPTISILFPKDGQIFAADIEKIDVLVDVVDNHDNQPQIEGNGTFILKPGFNTIFVTAVDSAGNVASSYILVEKNSIE